MEELKDYYDLDDYGGFWLRFAAYLIDSIALSVVLSPIFIIFLGSTFMGMADMDPNNLEDTMTPGMAAGMMGGMFLSYALYIVGMWLYFAMMESSSKQATLGKMAVGIIVTDQFGDRISFGRATGRYFGKLLSGMIMAIGFIIAAFTEKRQALHDILANTLVLKKDTPPLK